MARAGGPPRRRPLLRASRARDVVGGGEFRSGKVLRTGLIAGSTFGIKSVQYTVVDGLALFEGDIILGTEQQLVTQTDHLRAVQTGAVAAGVLRTGAQFRWPNCRIPYDINGGLPNQSRVTDAIAHWESNTHFKFVLRTSANAAQYPDWVTFQPSTGCSSSVGRQGGQQFVNLAGGCTTGNAIHEIGHVTGLWHEQSREDRDTFVTIHWDKIQAGMEHNFNQHITDGDDVGAYDYGSIMHYPRDAFSIDGSDTITPADPNGQIGQRTALSPGDIAAANSMCPKVIKEAPKDIVADTFKEQVKDIRLDTRKELILDTRKELAKERIKEVAFDPPWVKGSSDVIQPVVPGRVNPILPTGPVVGPAGAVPFAVATPHRAPAADLAPAQAPEAVTQLDAQLQALAEALAQTEAARESLQQQYDETAALLRQALDAHERGAGGGRPA